MSSFDQAIGTVLRHEVGPGYLTGATGFVDNPHDRGGETKYGISRSSYPWLDVANLTLDRALEIYRADFWLNFGSITSQSIATKAFDLAVLCGPTTAIRLLQTACQALGWTLQTDGVLGPATLAVVNGQKPDTLMPLLIKAAVDRFERIVSKDPDQQVFLAGWLTRARDTTIYPPPPGLLAPAQQEATA